jgi:CDP-glycerol glycerophosphotransferase (TagB/SpsB family)
VEQILREHQPALLFATHASSYFEESLLHAAMRLEVPTIFMVLSWDHLSSKVVLGSTYASLLVWNEVTKAEILRTTLAYSSDQIKVVGVPQFDCYAERPRLSYAEWCSKYGLDARRRTILFSTMPQVRHNQQHIVIERLAAAIGRDLPSDLQVLIKCHPFDNTDKYDALLDGRYPLGICRSTLPADAEQEEWFPSAEEMYISRDALYFCSLNINIFSTVTLEAAFLDKPIVHVAYDPQPVANRIPCREYYNFDHFRNIVASGASVLVESNEDLIAAVRASLENPGGRTEQRRTLVEQYFHDVRASAAAAVVATIEGIARDLSRRGAQ